MATLPTLTDPKKTPPCDKKRRKSNRPLAERGMFGLKYYQAIAPWVFTYFRVHVRSCWWLKKVAFRPLWIVSDKNWRSFFGGTLKKKAITFTFNFLFRGNYVRCFGVSSAGRSVGCMHSSRQEKTFLGFCPKFLLHAKIRKTLVDSNLSLSEKM